MVILFNIFEEKSLMLIGHKKFTSRMIFDVKMDFTRKSHLFLDGYKNTSPEGCI